MGKWSEAAKARLSERMKAKWEAKRLQKQEVFVYCPHCGKKLRG